MPANNPVCNENCRKPYAPYIVQLLPLVPSVARRKWIVTLRDRIGIAPPSVAALNANFSAAKIADDLAGSIYRLLLGVEYLAGPVAIGASDGPSIRMVNDLAIITVAH